MIGAFAGAMVVLALSVAFSWPVKVTMNAATPEEQQAAAAAAAFDSPTGTCLFWTTGNDMHKVDCVEPHLFEVTSNVDISADYPSSAPPPDLDTFRRLQQEKCTPSVVEYLGGKLDPFGKYSVGALKPRDEQWRGGDRKLRCGVQRAAPSGALVSTTGLAGEQDQSNVYDAGTCLALVEQAVGDPVDCVRAHAYEIVGAVDLGGPFPDEFPAEEKQQNKLAELCAPVVTQYTKNTDLKARKLTLTWDTLKEESWAAGSRLVDCKVGTRLADGSGLSPVSGSVKDIGLTEHPPETTTSKPGG